MPPILVLNPRSDATFTRRAARVVRDGVTRAEDLQAELRRTYPGAVVHRRILDGEQVETWYVYRDGRWVPTTGPRETKKT